MPQYIVLALELVVDRAQSRHFGFAATQSCFESAQVTRQVVSGDVLDNLDDFDFCHVLVSVGPLKRLEILAAHAPVP